MRTASKLISAIVLLACLSGIGLSQCGPYSCGSGACPQPSYCPYPYTYPHFQGYGVSTSNYYQAPPPYLAGGPAYTYTYPPGSCYYNPYPPGPPSYIAPPYPTYPYPSYPYPTTSQSYYNPYPQYLPPARTPATAAKPAAAPAKTTPPATKTASTVAPKKPAAPTKQPATTAKKDGSTAKTTDKQSSDSAATQPNGNPRPSFWRRLIWW